MKLFDTASHRVVPWEPPRDVRIYVCGITPYDAAHLGHILTFMTYDLLQRYLEDAGHTVTMVRNVTDVDEPIFAKAAELGVPYAELAERETASFQDVLQRLNFRTPAHQPLASDYIEPMAAAVQRLLDTGHAYYMDDNPVGDIYFDTGSDPMYGSFSGFDERLKLGLLRMRGGDPDRSGKRSPLDFLLWRAIAEPTDSAAWVTAAAPAIPRGRPGWHIECSVMSSRLLGGPPGLPFDLHGGGSDLIFPHHECEIAQTRALDTTPVTILSAASDVPVLARHWLHVAPLDYLGEKMSKSLGNLVFAKDLLASHESSVIRLALMNYHYRIGGEWIPCLLQESAELLQAVRSAVAANRVSLVMARQFGDTVRSALADDLDTHAILHALQDVAAAGSMSGAIAAGNAQASRDAANWLATSFDLLGLSLQP